MARDWNERDHPRDPDGRFRDRIGSGGWAQRISDSIGSRHSERHAESEFLDHTSPDGDQEAPDLEELDEQLDQVMVEELGAQITERAKSWETNHWGVHVKGRGAIYPPGAKFGHPEGYKLVDSHYVGDTTLGVYPTLEKAQEAYERWARYAEDRRGDIPRAIQEFRDKEAGR